MLEMASPGRESFTNPVGGLGDAPPGPPSSFVKFEDRPGTLVVDEDEIVEQHVVSGVAYGPDEAKITLVSVPDSQVSRPDRRSGDAAINVDMIVQNVSEDGTTTDLTFTVGRSELERAVDVLTGVRDELAFRELRSDANVAKVSVVGLGMRSQHGVAETMFRALADRGINIQVISTSEIKISVLIDSEYTELAVRAYHTTFGLDTEDDSENKGSSET